MRRPVTANATCGVGSSVQKETYCKLVAGFDRQDLASSSKDIIDGQVRENAQFLSSKRIAANVHQTPIKCAICFSGV